MLLTVNGTEREVTAPAHATLLSVLRQQLALLGAKPGCERGECGACTVLLNGTPAYACLTLAQACSGIEITTVEGLARNGTLHPVQRAFVEQDALQCGFCTPGQILAAVSLLSVTPRPDEAEIVRWMSGNLCRCGAYPKIVRAVQAAAEQMASTELADD
jgi:xanthine dehydrogenase YagT iron-sulfur-binding subunit